MNWFINNDIDYDGNPLGTDVDELTEDDFIFKVDQMDLKKLKKIIENAECVMNEDDYKSANEILDKYLIDNNIQGLNQ